MCTKSQFSLGVKFKSLKASFNSSLWGKSILLNIKYLVHCLACSKLTYYNNGNLFLSSFSLPSSAELKDKVKLIHIIDGSNKII